jgi:hypothetical protein
MSTRITLILATLAACLALAGTASATPAVPTSVFDPSETGWLSYRNLTSSQFAAKFAALKDEYMVVDIEVDVIDGAYRVGAVFRKNPDGRGWASLRNLSGDEFPGSVTASGSTPASGSRTARASAGRRTAA